MMEFLVACDVDDEIAVGEFRQLRVDDATDGRCGNLRDLADEDGEAVLSRNLFENEGLVTRGDVDRLDVCGGIVPSALDEEGGEVGGGEELDELFLCHGVLFL